MLLICDLNYFISALPHRSRLHRKKRLIEAREITCKTSAVFIHIMTSHFSWMSQSIESEFVTDFLPPHPEIRDILMASHCIHHLDSLQGSETASHL